ncbi:hypothetical protein [Rhizobium sp. NXC24]|uniref:hypothetical protein n=1 Tax=Rhizobium sp. NXC24 TaxID=2048897 RepID=UPI001FE0E5AE|nr:hypothetical protein [Rhizobium sp. NXC24]
MAREFQGELRVVKVLRNGKRRFDPVEKERLIDAALEPGVSVAGLALKYGERDEQPTFSFVNEAVR